MDDENTDSEMPRIKEESFNNLVDELIDRCDSACIVLNVKAFKDPCIIYHAENYSVRDLLSMIALLDVSKDWFKNKLSSFGVDTDIEEDPETDTDIAEE